MPSNNVVNIDVPEIVSGNQNVSNQDTTSLNAKDNAQSENQAAMNASLPSAVPDIISDNQNLNNENTTLQSVRSSAQSENQEAMNTRLPSSAKKGGQFSPFNFFVNSVIFIFALFVAFNYAILAFMRGNGEMGWAAIYAMSSLLANLPQYIFMPKKFIQRLKDLKEYGPTYAPYLVSMGVGVYFAYETFMSTMVMSRDSGDELASFFNFTASDQYLDGMVGSFSSAMGLTRFVSTATLMFMAYQKILMPTCEPWRAFLLKVHDDLKKENDHGRALEICPKEKIIDDKWLFEFYSRLNKSEDKEKSSYQRFAFGFGTLSLMVGCVFLIDLFKTLISRSTGSDDASVLVPAIIPNEGFYQWFCVIFFESVQSIFDRNSRSMAVAKMLPILVISYFSGGSYGTEAEKVDKDHAIFSGALNIIDKSVSYAVFAQIYAGIIANGGAIFATLKMYAEEIKRLSPLELSYLQAVIEVTFRVYDMESCLPDEIKHVEDCLKELKYGQHATKDFDQAMQWRKDRMNGKDIMFNAANDQGVEASVQTSNQDIFGNLTARFKRSFSHDSNPQQGSMVDDDQAGQNPRNKEASQSGSGGLVGLFKKSFSKSGSKAASAGSLIAGDLDESLLGSNGIN